LTKGNYQTIFWQYVGEISPSTAELFRTHQPKSILIGFEMLICLAIVMNFVKNDNFAVVFTIIVSNFIAVKHIF